VLLGYACIHPLPVNSVMDVSMEFPVYKNPYSSCSSDFFPLRIHLVFDSILILLTADNINKIPHVLDVTCGYRFLKLSLVAEIRPRPKRS